MRRNGLVDEICHYFAYIVAVNKAEFVSFILFGDFYGVLDAEVDPLLRAPHPLRALELVMLAKDIGQSQANEGVRFVPVQEGFALHFVLNRSAFTYP